MRIRGKNIWLDAVIVVAVVLGIAFYLWHRSGGKQNEQITTAPASADERSSGAVSQGSPGYTPNMFANGRSASSEPVVTSGLTENSGKQSDTVGAWERFLKNGTDERQVHEFIGSLSDDELLVLMEYCCSSNQIPAVEALLIPALKRRWGKDVPFEKLLDIVVATDQDNTFRVILTNFATVYGRGAELPTRDMIATRLMQIIINRDEAAELRGSVIMYLSGLLQEGVSAQTAYSDAFLNTLKDSSEDPKVVAAAVTASRRLGDKRAVPILVEKCLRDGDDLSRDVAMHTVVALAKYSKEEGVESPVRPIRQVMTTTRDDRVFGSSVYALSLLSTSDVYDALPDIMSSVARHAEQQTCQDAVASALRKHKHAVLHALNDENQEQIVAGLKACAIVSIPEAKERLRDLREKFPEHSVIINVAMRKAELPKDDNPEWRQKLREEKQNVD